jgi:D-alanyl-D-alanine carboxypeptidase/D-alanyl-D-alanine-endopeptidase (penicillin-binding protein 4)
MARQLFLTLGESMPLAPDSVPLPQNIQAQSAVSAQPVFPAQAERTDHMSIERSMLVMQTWQERNHLRFPEVVLENGAGLSRKERISPAHMAQLLQHASNHPLIAELQASLPILGVDGTVKKRLRDSPAASHAHLKTGSLEGVKALAGYVKSKSGQEWIVVFFINHPYARRGQDAQDALIEWVQKK